MIEIYIVGDEYFPIKQVINIMRHILKQRCGAYHFVAYPRKCTDINRDITLRVNQRFIPLYYFFAVMYANSYLGYAIRAGMPPGSLNIHNRVHGCKCNMFY
jgi:hypothetical protein